MFLRMMAILFGIAFIFFGVAGFLPIFNSDGLLFSWFLVDPVLNVVHIASGVFAIMSALKLKHTIWYFRLFGLFYLLLTMVGFWLNGDLKLMHVNIADNFLHFGIALLALFFGLRSIRK